MDDIKKGMLAISKAGHDFKKVYMVVDFDDEYVYLCDGVLRKADRPKKKKYKHIQIVKNVPTEWLRYFEGNAKPTDTEIKKAVKAFSDRFV